MHKSVLDSGILIGERLMGDFLIREMPVRVLAGVAL